MQVFVLDGIDEDGEVAVPQAATHDLSSEELQSTVFSTAVAAPEVETVDPMR